MDLSLVRHLWGVDLSRGYSPYVAGWRSVGYTALESSPRNVPDPQELRRVLKGEGFQWIPQVFSNMFAGEGSVELHLATMREQIEECLDTSPLFFNAHSGSDTWTLDEAEEFYIRVAELEAEIGVTISHETHRSRYLGNPWNTMRLLERVPNIKLTCDFSHWVCVAERLLDDAGPVFERVARNCHHLHARVGYEEGPQVSDPRAPEWKNHLLVHERWWELVWTTRESMGMNKMTLTPEFGPFPYLQTIPFTQEPVVDLATICDWMAKRQVSHFAAWKHGESLSEHGPHQPEVHENC
jgi:sugar phosphate isomerase/epimerase